MSEEPRLLDIPPQIEVVRYCPNTGMPATLCRAPYPRERVWAHRMGLVSTDEFVRDLVRHVRAESRRIEQKSLREIEALAKAEQRKAMRSALKVFALALVIDLVIGVLLLSFGQL